VSVAVPVPLLLVALVVGLRGSTALVMGATVVAAALIAAAAARWCAERRMRSEMEQHERELEHTKRQILGLVSHELRTPVTGVVGFSRTLSGRLDELDRGTLRLFVDAIDEHANRLARLVDNVVVASRTPLVVVGRTCRLSEVLSQAVRRVGLADDASRLRIALHGAMHVRIDEEAAIRILANLIDNAVKFGDPGGRIRVDGAERDGRVVVRVSNPGPEIPLGLRAALYEPFVQGDPTDTRSADGLGLGLHVCRQLVEAYGGSIDLVDDPRLIVFEVNLPAAYELQPEATRGHVTALDHRSDPVPDAPTVVPDHPQQGFGRREQVG
jgi:two-component system phosphate regulon sensor histidine kinase PhoR